MSKTGLERAFNNLQCRWRTQARMHFLFPPQQRRNVSGERLRGHRTEPTQRKCLPSLYSIHVPGGHVLHLNVLILVGGIGSPRFSEMFVLLSVWPHLNQVRVLRVELFQQDNRTTPHFHAKRGTPPLVSRTPVIHARAVSRGWTKTNGSTGAEADGRPWCDDRIARSELDVRRRTIADIIAEPRTL